MYLVSCGDQQVDINGESIRFHAGERIHIEDSHKYSRDSMAALGAKAGWAWVQDWTDDAGLFSVHLLRSA